MLFFETGGQAAFFLLMVPLGCLLGFLMQLSGLAGRWCLLTDVLFLLVCGMALFGFCIVKRENSLHLFHLLALLTGFLLYRFGIGRPLERLFQKRKKAANAAGKKRAASNTMVD